MSTNLGGIENYNISSSSLNTQSINFNPYLKGNYNYCITDGTNTAYITEENSNVYKSNSTANVTISPTTSALYNWFMGTNTSVLA